MKTKVYVICQNYTPIQVFTDFDSVREHCKNFLQTRDFASFYLRGWALDKNDTILKGKTEEEAWELYIDSHIENGDWGEYTWYEVPLN